MKKLALAALVAGALILSAVIPAAAAPNIYGTSGLIEVPDDIIYPMGAISLAYHGVFGTDDHEDTVNFFTAGLGLLPNLDVSGGVEIGALGVHRRLPFLEHPLRPSNGRQIGRAHV